MDINVNNAFPIAIKLTWGPCFKTFDVITDKITKTTCEVLIALLNRPLLTTLIILVILLMLITTLSLSVILVAGVLCFVFTIILLQGLAVLICLIFIFLLCHICVIFLSTVLGIKMKLPMKSAAIWTMSHQNLSTE